jgi:hypothetical protein
MKKISNNFSFSEDYINKWKRKIQNRFSMNTGCFGYTKDNTPTNGYFIFH